MNNVSATKNDTTFYDITSSKLNLPVLFCALLYNRFNWILYTQDYLALGTSYETLGEGIGF